MMPEMLMPRQCKAARALLDWRQRDLSHASGVALSTIRDFEAERHQLGTKGVSAIVKAFQKNGLTLMFDDKNGGVGVRFAEAAE